MESLEKSEFYNRSERTISLPVGTVVQSAKLQGQYGIIKQVAAESGFTNNRHASYLVEEFQNNGRNFVIPQEELSLVTEESVANVRPLFNSRIKEVYVNGIVICEETEEDEKLQPKVLEPKPQKKIKLW